MTKLVLLTEAERTCVPSTRTTTFGAPLHWLPRARMARRPVVAVENDLLAVPLLHISSARPPLAPASEYA